LFWRNLNINTQASLAFKLLTVLTFLFIYNEIAWVILEAFLREKIQMILRDLVNNLNASEA